MQKLHCTWGDSERVPAKIRDRDIQQLHVTRETVRDSLKPRETVRDMLQLYGTRSIVRESQQLQNTVRNMQNLNGTGETVRDSK